jgi:hypothetical protein
MGTGVVLLFHAAPASPCSIAGRIDPVEMVKAADAIVRATAVEYMRPPADPNIFTTGTPDSVVRFKVAETVKRKSLPSEVLSPGYLSDRDDYNDYRPPYTFAGMKTPAPIVTFDRTLMMCRPAGDDPRLMGCITADNIEAVEGGSERFQRRVFGELLSAEQRKRLATAFRERNRESHPFPGARLDGLIVVSPDGLEEVLKRESARTRGFTSFSLPAYSAFSTLRCCGLVDTRMKHGPPGARVSKTVGAGPNSPGGEAGPQ